MRHLLAAAAVALAAACTEEAPAPDAPPAPRDRPLAQDGSAARAIASAPDRARVQLDLSTVRAALKVYRAEHAAWPRSLDELTLEGRLAHPADLAYDPDTGTVTSKTYPAF